MCRAIRVIAPNQYVTQLQVLDFKVFIKSRPPTIIGDDSNRVSVNAASLPCF